MFGKKAKKIMPLEARVRFHRIPVRIEGGMSLMGTKRKEGEAP